MSESIHKSHNVSNLMYHFVFPAKYRRVVIDENVDKIIKDANSGQTVRPFRNKRCSYSDVTVHLF